MISKETFCKAPQMIQTRDSVTIRKAVVVPHKTLEERLIAFYGVPVEQVARIENHELDLGQLEGSEVW